MVSSKHAFWQALLAAILVFGVGIMLGFFLESQRADKVQMNLLVSEISLADEQLRNRLAENFNVSCSLIKQSTFEFADKIYKEAVQMEKYDSANTFKDILSIVHKKYDLLRMSLWEEAIKNKKNCKGDFHTIVYFYEYGTENIDKKALQLSFSHLLLDLKNENPNEILLIPVAANLNISSVELILRNYNIKELPSIIIDEKQAISKEINSEQIKKLLYTT